MKENLLESAPPILKSQKFSWLQRIARILGINKMNCFEYGTMILVEPDQETVFQGSRMKELQARVVVHNPRFFTEVVFGGTVGAGRSYFRGDWSCNELVKLIRIFTLNQTVMSRLEKGLARAREPFLKAFHFLRENTPRGSRKNIADHYDLGNDFFSLFLDETMTYSCAYFPQEGSSLYEASVAKMDNICRKLALQPGEHLLEIGSGWGSLALHAAKNYGARVTTTTVSENQYQHVLDRVRKENLIGQVTVLKEDYRQLQGRYDKLVSVEMIEAVGYRYYETFFEVCSRLLKDQGMFLLQAITIVDHAYEMARDSVDFIKRYIFPGGCLPSVSALCHANERAGDMNLSHLEDLTPHYVKTLKCWRDNFFRNLKTIRALGYPQEFLRTWEFYLAYCEGAFRERYIGVKHLLFHKPLCRQAHLAPAL